MLKLHFWTRALGLVLPGAEWVTLSAAHVQARVPVDGDMPSMPVMSPDGQTIYVTATDIRPAPCRA
jgi:hypothetical protein